MNYIGEHLWLGQAGHIFNLISFVASIIATVAFFAGTLTQKNQEESTRWIKLGRIFFYLETICVVATFLLLYIIISNHHKNTDPSFVNVMRRLYEFTDNDGIHTPLIS